MRRLRLTITLKEEIVKLLDTIADGKKIRNRSNAIESILESFFSSHIKTGVILSSGFSLIQKQTPECLLKIQDKTLIKYHLDLFQSANLERVIICSDHIEKIKKTVDPALYSFKIVYIKQKSNLGGAAKALKSLEKELKKDEFILLYGDVLVDINLLDFVHFFKNSNSVCTVALTSVLNPKEWGMIKMKGTQITEFQEKPNEVYIPSYLVNSGVFIFHPDIFSYLNKQTSSLERDILPILAKNNKLKGYVFDGQWFDTGKKEMYDKAESQWGGK